MDVVVDGTGEKGDGGWGAEGEWRLRRREGVLVFVCRNSSHLNIQPSHDSILPRGQFIVEFTEFPVLAFIVIQPKHSGLQQSNHHSIHRQLQLQ